MIQYPVFESSLENLRRNSLLRKIMDRASAQGPKIRIGEREYLNFASNDYLGLASHPRVVQAAQEALARFGAGSGASRLLAGGCPLHRELEERIAGLKGSEAALLFGSGYAANTAILPAITAPGDVILSDELNHASIVDGCRLSRAETIVYRHRDMEHLEALLKDSRQRRVFVVTDTVFSMDGSLAPLKEMQELLRRYEAALYLDDAHGTGVLGRGRGALSHFGLSPGQRPEPWTMPWTIQMGTLSKALGSFGAFAAADGNTIEWLVNTARSFMFSTALPPPAVAASLAALDILLEDDGLLDRLWANRDRLAAGVKALGFETGSSETPIIPLFMKDVGSALGLSERLLEKGIYAPAIRPPTVREPRIRITVTASHAEEDLDGLVGALRGA